MKILGIIPARFASTRFPGKPLAMIGDKSMIERVYHQATSAKGLDAVIIATDDERIAAHVRSFGADVVMTSAKHPSGTDRCAEAILKYGYRWDAVVNIQGDEPFIKPEQINLVVDCLSDESVQIATLVKVITEASDLTNPNNPKVILKENGDAIYFSRQALPYFKGIEVGEWLKHHTYYKHIGIYGYRTIILPQLTAMPQGKLEIAESLEQLRWLEFGINIRTKITEFETIAIDTPEDLERAKILLV